MTLLLDDDWLVGAGPHVVRIFPNNVTPLRTTFFIEAWAGFVSSGHL